MCAANELFFCMIYMTYFTNGPIIPVIGVGLWKLILVITAPISFAKMAISVLQLLAGCENYAIMDRAERGKTDNKQE